MFNLVVAILCLIAMAITEDEFLKIWNASLFVLNLVVFLMR